MLSGEACFPVTACKKPAPFLKALLLHLGREECRRLHDGLVQTEREQRCIRRAMFLAVLLFLLAGAGLGYCAVLLPELFDEAGHPVVPGLLALALGALISQAMFVGYSLWHRAEVNRLHEDCRRLILDLAASQLHPTALRDPPGRGAVQPPRNSPSPPSPPRDETLP